MEVYRDICENYVIKLYDDEEAFMLYSILKFINSRWAKEKMEDRASKEELRLAEDIADELDTYLKFKYSCE